MTFSKELRDAALLSHKVELRQELRNVAERLDSAIAVLAIQQDLMSLVHVNGLASRGQYLLTLVQAPKDPEPLSGAGSLTTDMDTLEFKAA